MAAESKAFVVYPCLGYRFDEAANHFGSGQKHKMAGPCHHLSPSPFHEPDGHVVGRLLLRVEVGAATLLRLCRGKSS
jgi:hypothetical protein